MLWMKKDTARGGERFAIPTEGEIEGKLIVLESIAIACVEGSVLRGDADALAKLRGEIARLVQERCKALTLAPDDERAAQQYALEFFDAIIEETIRRTAKQ